MAHDEDIPVLTDAVRRKDGGGLTDAQIDELCDGLSAEAWVLIDNLVGEALRDVEDKLRVQINDRLGDELPQLIEKTLREKLSESAD